jgi:glycosyltransferase involved in cell wall biosynthesis
MTFYVFSFNRGAFLQNCVQSILDLAPGCPVVVIDDNSTDSATQEVLRSLPPEVTLLPPPPRTEGRHGGLYTNMQAALEHAPEYLMAFIQDDMQLVRPVDAADLRTLEEFFAAHPRCAFVNPGFFKGSRRRRKTQVTHPVEGTRFYFRHYPEKANYRGIWFNDVHIAHAPRLRSAGWEYVPGEIANAAQAHAKFDKMGVWADPIMMHLPSVPVFRGKQKTWSMRMADRLLGTDPKPYRPLTREQTDALCSRPLSVLPFAEDFLDCTDPKVKKPFHYSSVSAVPLLHLTNSIERSLRKLFR